MDTNSQASNNLPFGDIQPIDSRKYGFLKTPEGPGWYLKDIYASVASSINVDAASYSLLSVCTGAGTCVCYISTDGTCMPAGEFIQMTSNTATRAAQILPGSCSLYLTTTLAGDGVTFYGLNLWIDKVPCFNT